MRYNDRMTKKLCREIAKQDAQIRKIKREQARGIVSWYMKSKPGQIKDDPLATFMNNVDLPERYRMV